MNDRKPATGPSRRTERRLWFALLAAPVAWMLHEVIGVSIIGRSCTAGALPSWKWVTLLSVSATALIVAIAAAVVAYRTFKGWTEGGKIATAEGWNRVEFMAQLGFFLSLLLLLNIVLFGIVPLMVNPCAHYSG